MLLITIFSVIIEIIIIFIAYPPGKAWKKALLYVDLLTMLVGYICYMVKTGGYRASFIPILLFSDQLRDIINNLSISYYHLYLVIQTTRLAFPLLLLLITIDMKIFQPATLPKVRMIIAASILPPLIIWGLLLRPIYFCIFKDRFMLQDAMQLATIIYMIVYAAIAVSLMVVTIKNAYLSWYKRQYMYSLLSIISLLCIYFIFSIMDPILLVQDYSSITVRPYSYFINYKIGTFELIGISGLMLISAAANSVAIYKDAKIELSKTTQEMTIARTMKETDMLTRGLIHGLKNRLLIEKVIALDLLDMIEEGADKQALIDTAHVLVNEQNRTSEHMDKVRRTLKDIDTHLKFEKTDALFTEIKQIYEEKFPASIEFDIEEGAILADKDLMKEAIANMIDNSLDSGATRICIKERFTNSECIIEIADNGCGIDNDMMKRIFLPFATTKNIQNNWGFGLCFARQVIKKHLGDIQFHSEKGKGTTFYIILPRLY